MPTPWARYVKDLTAGAPQGEIATRSGVGQSVLSRWISGGARPRPELAIQFARAYGRPPVEALVRAGYLEPGEVTLAPAAAGMRPVGDYTDEEIVAEIERYWVERSRLIVELVSRFLGRPVEEFEAPVTPRARAGATQQQQRQLPDQVGDAVLQAAATVQASIGPVRDLSDADLIGAVAGLFSVQERSILMAEVSRRLLERTSALPEHISREEDSRDQAH